MKVSHGPATLFAAFDAPDLIAHAGLVPTIRLAERCDLPALVAEKVKLTGAKNGAGTAADAKALSIVGGMHSGGLCRPCSPASPPTWPSTRYPRAPDRR